MAMCAPLVTVPAKVLDGWARNSFPIPDGTFKYTATGKPILASWMGGASVAGGRGSFVSTLLGAALVQATSSASSYINANSSVHYTVIGTLTVLAAIFFSLARRRAAGG